MPSLRNWRKKRVTESNDKKVPALRFKGFTDDWEQRKPGDFLVESKIIGHKGDKAKKLTVKLWGKGVQEKQDILSGSANTQYYIRKSGQLMYGKLDFLHAAFGIVPSQLNNYESTIDSPSFDVKSANSIFLLNLFLRKKFYLYYGERANGSRKAKRIHEKDFLVMPIKMPEINEQNKISNLIEIVNNRITLQQRKLEQIKLLKKAMLQKILAETDNPYPKLRFFGFSNTWKKYTVNSLFKISRGYVLSTTLTEANKSAHNPYPVYSSQTKNNGLMGYYNKYLYENAITWTTDGANAGTVNYRSGKFYCTNVCGVILSDKVDANQLIAEELNTVSKRYVSYVGNPKLMNNVMANIKIIIPDQYKERQQISQLFSRQDIFKDVYQRKQNVLKILKQFLLQNMFI